MTPRNSRRATLRKPQLRTAAQARQWLRDNGLSAAQFARDNGLSHHAVKEVLNNRSKANFGQCHLAAVALGMKRNPQNNTVSPKTARA